MHMHDAWSLLELLRVDNKGSKNLGGAAKNAKIDADTAISRINPVPSASVGA
jgi:hypothetical protein